MTKFKRIIPQAHLYLPDGTDYWLTKVPAQEFLEKPVVRFSAIPNIPQDSKIAVGMKSIGLMGYRYPVFAIKYPTDRQVIIKGDFLIEMGSPRHALLVEFDTRNEPEMIPLTDYQIKEMCGVKTHAKKS